MYSICAINASKDFVKIGHQGECPDEGIFEANIGYTTYGSGVLTGTMDGNNVQFYSNIRMEW
jgi:hypothetical protein